MNIQIRTNSVGDITLQFKGQLEYQNSLTLHQKLEDLANKNPSSLIILDLYHLEFVGSSGIKPFTKTIKTLNNKRNQIRLSNVSKEFVKVFELFEMNVPEILIDEFQISNLRLHPPRI